MCVYWCPLPCSFLFHPCQLGSVLSWSTRVLPSLFSHCYTPWPPGPRTPQSLRPRIRLMWDVDVSWCLPTLGESTVCFTVDFPLEIQILLQFVYVIIWMFCLITTNFSTYTGSAKFYGDVTCIWIHRSTFLVSLERNVESLCEGGPSRMSADALVPFDVRASPAIC